jgi:uncharacterized protein (TIGR02996 family)
MNDLTALLIEARLAPGDDAPRLVLADWLEENGDDHERALSAFVRIQCELPRLSPRAPARADLEWVQRQLWWDHVEAWLGPVYDACSQFEFRRGLASVELAGDRLAGWDLDALFAAAGWCWVDEVRFVAPAPAQLDALLASPAAAGLCRLDVRDCKGEWRPRIEAAPGHPPLLRHLRIAHARLNDRALERLAESKPLAALEALELPANAVAGDGLEGLGHAPGLTRLRALALTGNALSPQSLGLAQLGNSPLARRLEVLVLRSCALGEGAVRHLATAREWPSLVELDLAGNALNDDDVESLCESGIVRALRRLDLSENDLGRMGLRALANCPALDALEVLDLSLCGLSSSELNELVEAPVGRLVGLRRLRLIGSWLDSERQRGQLYGRFGGVVELP